jgi:uncharacterized protein (TIGR01777 family)
MALHILVSGAGGLIGTAVVRHLTSGGHRITRLVRRAAGAHEVLWDPVGNRLDLSGTGRVDAVVHLAGENIGTRWTTASKARILDSRARGTRLLSTAIARLQPRPEVLVSASAIGIYGNRGNETLTEESPPGDPSRDFLVAVCQEWEAGADPARAAGIRVVHPRFGVVLSRAGGALRKMLPVFRLGLGGRLGSGSQWMSWISRDDAVGVIQHALIERALVGPVNATAPEPVSNAEFTRRLGEALGRPTPFRVPASALRLAFGAMADSTVLTSTRVLPARLQRTGYRFVDPELPAALRHVLAEPN